MYTIFQIKKAIKLYIKCGLKAAPVINKLGYPDHIETNRVIDNEIIAERLKEDERSKIFILEPFLLKIKIIWIRTSS